MVSNQANNIHVVSHRMPHLTFGERELATYYATLAAVQGHTGIANFIRWVRRKLAEFIDRAIPGHIRDKHRAQKRRR
ncbi:MAG: hypothetical protein VX430_03210 [Pseudomonadota bacterium]|nr:hypothetical protein [Pseudomonadota bacterium]